MKYDDISIDQEPITTKDEDEIIYVGGADKCEVCGDLTHWASISFMARFCSEECYDKYSASFWEALTSSK